ncbi:hypothetical protein HYO65_gp216 [Tenacibaculum phage PTm1]|uniref:Uncharacterized protein n=2 Tax=Shirahamavirus PTm1 TaxID=2846435 RepID=A0A5S9EQU8_9CAUD|nr:hypothetical protein HYO65_gp216 [Tenacibaculum phage PTm1]BBI90608.1 hypothetical protein [Tenacibaculum phage PTm1]BBI90914.1 hypothetical protein [Tenacibaculum phage PTm5]
MQKTIQIQVKIFVGDLEPKVIRKVFKSDSDSIKFLEKLNTDKLQTIYELTTGNNDTFKPSKYLINSTSPYGTNFNRNRYFNADAYKTIKVRDLYHQMANENNIRTEVKILTKKTNKTFGK